MDLFTGVPKLTLETEPELAELGRLLDEDVISWQVNTDLARRAS